MTPLDVLDPRTLAISASLAGFIFSTTLWGAVRDGEPIDGARHWFGAALLISLGLGTNALQDLVADVFTRVLANVCLVAASFLLWQGSRHFNGRSVSNVAIYTAALLTLVLNLAFTLVWPSVPARVFVTSIGLLFGAALTVIELRRIRAPHLRLGVTLSSLPLAFFVVLMGVRAVTALFGNQQQFSLAPTPINVATHLTGHLVLLTTLAGLTTLVNATRAAQVRALAYADQLTGALSRRGFYSALDNFRLSPIKSSQLFVFDIDRFKAVNDEKGHDAGDKLLKLLASTIRDFTPSDALIARFGGDEFVVLTRSLADPDSFTEKVRRVFRERSGSVLNEMTLFPSSSKQLMNADVSVGYAQCDAVSEPQFAHALRRADHAMYAAKVRQRQLPPV